MLKRLLSGLSLWTLIVGCGVASTETSVLAQNVTAQALPAAPVTPPMTPHAQVDRSVGRQMLALDRHARVNMILYTGRFSESERAAAKAELDAIARTLKAGGKEFRPNALRRLFLGLSSRGNSRRAQ